MTRLYLIVFLACFIGACGIYVPQPQPDVVETTIIVYEHCTESGCTECRCDDDTQNCTCDDECPCTCECTPDNGCYCDCPEPPDPCWEECVNGQLHVVCEDDDGVVVDVSVRSEYCN